MPSGGNPSLYTGRLSSDYIGYENNTIVVVSGSDASIYDSSISNQSLVTVTILTPNCGIIFLDYLVVVDCNSNEGCYGDNGLFYSVGSVHSS